MDDANLNDNLKRPIMTMVKGFVVPPLQPGDRISDWEPLFKAAVTPLLAQADGQTLAIGLLPAHVNRRTAEKELVQEAIQKNTLDAAFDLLKTLDDPIDPYEAMQKLCRRNWLHGVHIDDFFYDLKRLAKDAEADTNLICNIIIAQLPKTVQIPSHGHQCWFRPLSKLSIRLATWLTCTYQVLKTSSS